MEIVHPERLGPHILLGIVNEKLRLGCNSLEQLSDDLGISKKEIEQRMNRIHFHYQSLNNQFKPD